MLDVSKLKHVVFDWDNTLVESRSSLTAAINIVLAHYNLPAWDDIKHQRDCNLSFKDNFPNIFGAKSEEAYNHYRKIYLEIMPYKIKAYPYTEELLQYFKNKNIKTYVASNKERILLEKEKHLLFPHHNFQKIVCGHEAFADKPSPEQIFHTLKDNILSHEITPEQVWVVGDSPMDSQAAIAANAKAIRIGRSIWGDEGETDSNITYFNSFKDFYQNLLTHT